MKPDKDMPYGCASSDTEKLPDSSLERTLRRVVSDNAAKTRSSDSFELLTIWSSISARLLAVNHADATFERPESAACSECRKRDLLVQQHRMRHISPVRSSKRIVLACSYVSWSGAVFFFASTGAARLDRPGSKAYNGRASAFAGGVVRIGDAYEFDDQQFNWRRVSPGERDKVDPGGESPSVPVDG